MCPSTGIGSPFSRRAGRIAGAASAGTRSPEQGSCPTVETSTNDIKRLRPIVDPLVIAYRTRYKWNMRQLPDDMLRAALALPPEARAALAGQLIASLDEVDEDAEVAWSDEIERRIVQLESGAVNAIPWLEARRKILG